MTTERESSTTSMDTDRQKRLGGRVMAGPVRSNKKQSRLNRNYLLADAESGGNGCQLMVHGGET